MWKFFPHRKMLAIQEFSTIEKDSGCQLLWALELTPDPKDKALIFQHVLEEFFHAEIFEDLSLSYAKSYLPKTIPSREILVDKKSTPAEVWEFFSYAHVGEEGVNRDFVYYAKANLDKKIAAVFSRVSQDEFNHIYGTRDILEKITMNNRLLCNWLILKSTVKRKIKQIESSTRFIGDGLLTLLLVLVYYFLGFFVHSGLKKRFNELSEKETLNLLIQQEADL